MRHQGFHLGTFLLQLSMQGIGEDHIGQLGLLISLKVHPFEHGGAVAAQVATIPLQILGIQLVVHVLHDPCSTGMVHHTRLAMRGGGLLQEGHAKAGQQEVREMIGLHLNVTAIFRGNVPKSHNASVVAQDIQAAVLQLAVQLGPGAADALETRQVAGHLHGVRGTVLPGNGADVPKGFVRTDGVAVQQDQLGALARTDLRKDLPGARGATRHRHHFARHLRETFHHTLKMPIATAQVSHREGRRRGMGHRKRLEPNGAA
mmetsp:Transcript_4188/g.5241  ORF Transcript_4188/g.5241 Transcript_4188/m.5241 type:complete len:260 (+) Transcript_4188:393-1172(+)